MNRTYPGDLDETFCFCDEHLGDVHVPIFTRDLQSRTSMSVADANVSSVCYQNLHLLDETVTDSQQ